MVISRIAIEKFHANFSEKNIPVPSKDESKLQLLSKVEIAIKGMRWKALLGKATS